MRNAIQLAVILVLTTNITAHATDLSQVLFDFRGDPVTDETRPGPRDPQTGKLTAPRFCFAHEFKANRENCDYLTLGVAMANALMRGSDPEMPDPSIDDIKKRSVLANKIMKGGNIELSLEDKVIIRRMVKKYYNPVVSVLVIEALEK